jgi:hypothetical protein
MKRILTTAVLAMAMSAAWGQAKAPEAPARTPAAAPADKSPAAAPADAAKPQAAEAPKATVARKPNPRRFEDARHCLEKGNNTEIIKCAEVYL